MSVTPASRIIVEIDPDGTDPNALLVVVQAPTGIFYNHQCRGVANDQRYVEGYLVPVATGVDGATRVDAGAFISPFHSGNTCIGHSSPLDSERLDRLRRLVGGVAFWPSAVGSVRDGSLEVPKFEVRLPRSLTLDEARLGEVCEGWTPVLTPDGPGILLSPNCD